MDQNINKNKDVLKDTKQKIISRIHDHIISEQRALSVDEVNQIISLYNKSSGLAITIDFIDELIVLAGYQYVLKEKDALLRVLESIDNQLQYPSASTNQKMLEEQKYKINEIVSELDKTKIEGDDLWALMAAHSKMYNEALRMISLAKKSFEEADFLDKDLNELIITDAFLKEQFMKKEKGTKPDSEIIRNINTVLNILYSMGIVFFGHYQKKSGSYEYFYLDISLVDTDKQQMILHKMKRIIEKYPDRPELSAILAQMNDMFTEKKMQSYKDDFSTLQVKLSEIYKSVSDNKTDDQLVMNYTKLWQNTLQKIKDFKRESHFFGKIDVETNQIKACLDQINKIEAAFSSVPIDFINFLEQNYNRSTFIELYKDHNFINQYEQAIKRRFQKEEKGRLLLAMWRTFKDYFNRYLNLSGNYQLIEHLDIHSNRKNDAIQSGEYYIQFDSVNKINCISSFSNPRFYLEKVSFLGSVNPFDTRNAIFKRMFDYMGHFNKFRASIERIYGNIKMGQL